MKALKSFKSLFATAMSLEGETGIGKYNLMWARYNFITWVISVLIGFSLTVTPANPESWWSGLRMEIGDQSFTILLWIVLLNLPICMLILLLCYKWGLIDRDFNLK